MISKSIRKISVGSDVNNQLHISVGSVIAGSKVSVITELDNCKYEVWVEKEGTKDLTVWKRISGMPVIVEYNNRLE